MNIIFFQLMTGSKSYTTKSLELNSVGNTKKSQKVKIIFSPYNIIFLSTCEALIHSTWTSNEKVMDNLVFWAI